jgi:foldase protein PrsA
MAVSPEDVASYWRDNRARLDLPEQRYGKIILCASEQIAQQVRTEAAAGRPWDELMKRYSSDQTNKQNGGNYGPVLANAEGSHVRPIFAVARGDLSAVIKFEKSWAVARVDSIVAPRARELDEVSGEVGDILTRRRQEEKLQQMLAEWRQQFPVKIHARRLDKASSWAQLTALPPAENPPGKPAVK